MRIFKITKEIEIVCRYEKTRYGFRHLATLFINGVEKLDAKCTYQNRTWEKYDFQSVLFETIRKSDLQEKDKKICNNFIENYKESDSMLNTIAMVAKIGEVMCNNIKDKNDWKARMLKAGLENKGLIMPDDWDSLDEKTKQERLDNAINTISDVVRTEKGNIKGFKNERVMKDA